MVAAAEAYRLMKAGRLEEALVFAERAVAGLGSCLPEHGLLASVLLKLGRPDDAETSWLSRGPGLNPALPTLTMVSPMSRWSWAGTIAPTPCIGGPLRSHPRIRGFGTTSRAASAVSAGSPRRKPPAIEGLPWMHQYPTYLLRSELRVQCLRPTTLRNSRRNSPLRRRLPGAALSGLRARQGIGRCGAFR